MTDRNEIGGHEDILPEVLGNLAEARVHEKFWRDAVERLENQGREDRWEYLAVLGKLGRYGGHESTCDLLFTSGRKVCTCFWEEVAETYFGEAEVPDEDIERHLTISEVMPPIHDLDQ